MAIGFLYFLIYLFFGIFSLVLGGVFLVISASIKNKKEKYCKQCGREVKDAYTYCPSCGKELHVGYNETARIIFLTLGIFAIFVGVCFFLLSFVFFLFFLLLY